MGCVRCVCLRDRKTKDHLGCTCACVGVFTCNEHVDIGGYLIQICGCYKTFCEPPMKHAI